MSKNHSPQFLRICEAARKVIKEITIDKVKSGSDFVLLDIREDHEWQLGHLPGAIHLGRGILERDIEEVVKDPSQKIVLYCGGGYRSALAALSLKEMGYSNVYSMAGGFRGWVERGLDIEAGE